MSSIGSRTVMTIGGAPNPTGDMVADITRPFVSGQAFMGGGAHGAVETLQTIVDLGDADDVYDEIVAYKLLQGQLVTIVDDLGNTWDEVMVHQVVTDGGRYIACPVGGITGGNYLLTATWTIQSTDLG